MTKANNDFVLSTGELSGATWLHSSTIYRYVDEFPQFFSPGARKHGRGRRWTKDDLDNILAIRTLHHSHVGHEAIADALESNWRPPSGSADDRADLARTIITLTQLSDQLQADLKAAEAKAAENEHRLFLLEGRGKNLELQIYRLETAFTQLKAKNNLM